MLGHQRGGGAHVLAGRGGLPGLAGGRVLLGHPPDARAEAVVLDELGELDPRLDLLRGRVVGQLRRRGAHPGLEAGLDVEARERLVEELGDDPPALFAGQVGELVHGLHLLWVAGSSGDRP